MLDFVVAIIYAICKRRIALVVDSKEVNADSMMSYLNIHTN